MEVRADLPPLTEFDSDQYAEAYGPGVENDFWHRSRNAIILNQLALLGPGRVLDVGCGRGILVDYLGARGVDCFGVELGRPRVPAHLESKLFIGCAAGELAAEFRQSVRTLVLGDVIEHLPDPPTFLADLWRDFPRATGALLTVPARQELWSNYDEHYGHYRRYDLDQLEREVAQSGGGWRVVDCRYAFRLLYPLARLLLLTQKRRPTRIESPRFLPIHAALGALLTADFRYLPRSWYGSSVICVLKRSVTEPDTERNAVDTLEIIDHL